MQEPAYKGTTLSEAIDGLMAYDGGSTDSGISDPEMKDWVFRQLTEEMSDVEANRFVAHLIRDMLSDERLSQGYGVPEIAQLLEWLDWK